VREACMRVCGKQGDGVSGYRCFGEKSFRQSLRGVADDESDVAIGFGIASTFALTSYGGQVTQVSVRDDYLVS